MKSLHELSIAEAGAALRSGCITSSELTRHALARIASVDSSLHSFILVTRDRALEDARRADIELRAGIDRGPLHGVPYALKDLFDTAGIPTTCHSGLRVRHVPTEDCHIESRLKTGGAVLLGKLAMTEFALGGPSLDLPFPASRNPWNLAHFTGGSSSGAAAAVAAGLVPFAIGSDTAGSIRGPACYCGTVGLKPTFGVVSRRGAFPLSYSLDHCGPITWTVRDAAAVMQVIAGYDPQDPVSVDREVPDFHARIGKSLHGLRIGLPRHYFDGVEDTSPEVTGAVEAAARTFSGLGATVEEIRLPDFELFNACGRVILSGEAYTIHEDDLKMRPRAFSRYTYQRLVLGAALTAADLTQALRLRRELTMELNLNALKRYDALLTATSLGPAPRLDSFPADWPPKTRMQTIPYNVTGNPALAMPAGFSVSGLPLGIQIVGRPFDEATVFQIAAAFEAAAGLFGRRPDLQR